MNLDIIWLFFSSVLIIFLIAFISLIFDNKDNSQDLLKLQKDLLGRNHIGKL